MTKNRIKELRNSTNPKTTLKELSEKLREKGLSFTDSQLSQYEQGNRSPRNSEIWQALAEIFNVSVGYLLGNTDMPKDIIENYNYKQEINSFIKDLDESNYKNWDLIEKSIYLQCIQAISLLSVEERKFINEYLWALLEKRSSESN